MAKNASADSNTVNIYLIQLILKSVNTVKSVNCKSFIISNIVGWSQSSSRDVGTNLLFVYKLEVRPARWEGARRFPGTNLKTSHLFSIISRQIKKPFLFIDITGWVA